MGINEISALRRLSRVGVVLLMALTLAACATSRRAEYRAAPGSYFTAPIRSGDSVASVSQRYRVRQDDIVAINNLKGRDAKLRGKTIRVPAYGQTRTARAEPSRGGGRGNARGGAGRGGKNGAGRGGRGGKAVVSVRPLSPPNGKAKGGTRVAKDASPARGNANPKSDRGTGKGTPPARQTATNTSTSEGQRLTQSSGKKFLWPVSGNVISTFGQGAGGERNDGINISTRRGTPVHAADAGTITYVGNELKGYGNLVLIRHDSGYVTAYAHSDSVVVERGDRVQRGQVIAYAGATGDVNQPQVHFELRYNTKPVNPVPYLIRDNELPASRIASSPTPRPSPG